MPIAETPDTRTLYRPVGRNELALIQDSGNRGFPERLAGQPIFYPVLNFEYAEQIARDWNSTDPSHDHVGYVMRFEVLTTHLELYEPHTVGGQIHAEYWIPAQALDRFNDAIVGPIEVVAEYRHGHRHQPSDDEAH
jgi:hypothetical protein